jgi:small subunit ribosomal protein S1
MEPWSLGDVQGHVEAYLVYIKEMAQLHEVAPGEIRVEPGQQPAQKSTGKRITSDVVSLDQVLWSRLAKAWAKVEYVEGIILDQVDRGFTVDLGGAVAFLPASQVDIRPSPDVTRLKNIPQTFQILKMDCERGTILVSRRTVPEAIRCERMLQLEEGQVVEGVVDNIVDEGAFGDLGGGVIGQLPSPDIAWRRVNHPTEVLGIGQQVKVKIIKVDPEVYHVWVGIRQLLDDPWQGIDTKFPVGGRFKGRVIHTAEYGAFVELEPGVEGLLHVSDMSRGPRTFSRELVRVGQEIDVQILEVDAVKRRISLKTLEAEPEMPLSS